MRPLFGVPRANSASAAGRPLLRRDAIRHHGEGSIFQRGRYWHIQYSDRGRVFQESSSSTEKTVATKLLRRRLSELVTGKHAPDAGKVTLADLRALIEADHRLNQRRATRPVPRAFRHLDAYFGAEPELDRLSNILKTFNAQFGSIPWTDADRVHQLITVEIPTRVAADRAYQNAAKNSDKTNARIEHDKALGRVMTAVLKDDTELFKQFSDNESFRRWLTDTVFGLTYTGVT